MFEYGNVAVVAAITWAVPIVLAAAQSKWPEARQRYPLATAVLISGLFAAAISFSSILIYDRFTVPKNVVVFAHEDGKCPSGYRDNSTALISTWKSAPERFQTARDINTTQGPVADGNWPWDHIKICLKE
ncbi:hypothetical protein V1283_002977 [Bradyrhizobium sp. AZCC 2262]|uniref:hypothetical protein n=1 Tax=Bradyrhizobium sp. AZCC 2262 TaxID=3117022 RepID=UPI002FF20441